MQRVAVAAQLRDTMLQQNLSTVDPMHMTSDVGEPDTVHLQSSQSTMNLKLAYVDAAAKEAVAELSTMVQNGAIPAAADDIAEADTQLSEATSIMEDVLVCAMEDNNTELIDQADSSMKEALDNSLDVKEESLLIESLASSNQRQQRNVEKMCDVIKLNPIRGDPARNKHTDKGVAHIGNKITRMVDNLHCVSLGLTLTNISKQQTSFLQDIAVQGGYIVDRTLPADSTRVEINTAKAALLRQRAAMTVEEASENAERQVYQSIRAIDAKIAVLDKQLVLVNTRVQKEYGTWYSQPGKEDALQKRVTQASDLVRGCIKCVIAGAQMVPSSSGNHALAVDTDAQLAKALQTEFHVRTEQILWERLHRLDTEVKALTAAQHSCRAKENMMGAYGDAKLLGRNKATLKAITAHIASLEWERQQLIQHRIPYVHLEALLRMQPSLQRVAEQTGSCAVADRFVASSHKAVLRKWIERFDLENATALHKTAAQDLRSVGKRVVLDKGKAKGDNVNAMGRAHFKKAVVAYILAQAELDTFEKFADRNTEAPSRLEPTLVAAMLKTLEVCLRLLRIVTLELLLVCD